MKLMFSSNKTGLHIEKNWFLKSSNYEKIYSKMSRKIGLNGLKTIIKKEFSTIQILILAKIVIM